MKKRLVLLILFLSLLSACESRSLPPYTPSADQVFFIQVQNTIEDKSHAGFRCDGAPPAYHYDPPSGPLYLWDTDQTKNALALVGHNGLIGYRVRRAGGTEYRMEQRCETWAIEVVGQVPTAVSLARPVLRVPGYQIYPLEVEALGADGRVRVRYRNAERILVPGVPWTTKSYVELLEGTPYTTTLTITNWGLLDRATQVLQRQLVP
jgi:hypothetical protein